MKEEQSYAGYCSQLRMVNDQLVEVKKLSARSHLIRRDGRERSPETKAIRAMTNDNMDWEPTTATASGRLMKKEPRWASPREIERRRQEGLCLRCGQDAHIVRRCQAKLVLDEEKNSRTSSGKKKTTAKIFEAKDSTFDSEESGKE